MSEIIFRGKPPNKQDPAPTWMIIVAIMFVFAFILGIGIPSDSAYAIKKSFEYEKDGMYCHEKTVCCNPNDQSTCTSFESCRYK
jgi:hypothetical protein